MSGKVASLLIREGGSELEDLRIELIYGIRDDGIFSRVVKGS